LDLNDDNIRKRIESPEYLSLLKKCFRDWSAAESEAKRIMVCNLLSNAAVNKICTDDVVRMFTQWIDDYSEIHFKVIRWIYKNPGCTRWDIWIPDFTAGARRIVELAKLDDCFRPPFWKKLRWFALVEPNKDAVPIRAKFGLRADSDPTLAWIFLTSKQPFWMTGTDVIAAKLITGTPIKILEAIKVVPHGVQPGLVSVNLRSQMKVNARRHDLAVKLVELRNSVKSESSELARGLKVATNSAAFAIFSQLDVRSLDSRSPLRVFSGEADYLTPPVEIWERPSEFHLPRHQFICHGRLAFTLRDVGAHGARYGRSDCRDGHR
jgi:hypothetical protein